MLCFVFQYCQSLGNSKFNDQLSNISISNICMSIEITIKNLMNYLQIFWDIKLANRLIKLLYLVYLKVIEILLR